MKVTYITTPFGLVDASIQIERTEALNDEINHFSELVASLNLSADDNNDLVEAAVRLLLEAEKSGYVSGVQTCVELARA